MLLSFSSQQDRENDSLPINRNEGSNSFHNDTNIENTYSSSNENVISISQHESNNLDIVEIKSIQSHNETCNSLNESDNSNESLHNFEITHKEKEFFLKNEMLPTGLEKIIKDSTKDRTNKDEISQHTFELNEKIPLVTQYVDELQTYNKIPESKNNKIAPNDLKLTKKSTIFVGMLVSLARKRMKS